MHKEEIDEMWALWQEMVDCECIFIDIFYDGDYGADGPNLKYDMLARLPYLLLELDPDECLDEFRSAYKEYVFYNPDGSTLHRWLVTTAKKPSVVPMWRCE